MDDEFSIVFINYLYIFYNKLIWSVQITIYAGKNVFVLIFAKKRLNLSGNSTSDTTTSKRFAENLTLI